ncbi:MAG: hypothetical protein ACJ75J_08795 [Cytophagaceae bacterium]
MIKIKILTVILYFKSLLSPCVLHKDPAIAEKKPHYKMTRIGELPAAIDESSAVIPADTASSGFVTLNDHGGKPELYRVFPQGKTWNYTSWKVSRSSNYDWEELARDDRGNIYIGDFGNNYNNRRNLRIYIVNPADSLKTDSISFSFEDQKLFPPAKDDMNFDCEAFFWYDHHLYLFSKNRGKGLVKVYKLPDQPGAYQAKLFDSLNVKGMITSADISPDKRNLVLLSYGRIYFFKLAENGSLRFQGFFCRKFPRGGQSEAICFLNNNDLLITNEGRKIFLMKRKK